MKRKKKHTACKVFLVILGVEIIGGLTALFAYRYIQQKSGEESTVQVIQDIAQTGKLEESIADNEVDWEPITKATTETEAEEETLGKYGKLLKEDSSKLKEENIYIKEAASTEETSLLFAGDVLMDDSYAVMNSLRQSGNGIQGRFSEDLWNMMQTADIFMLNNEFTFTDRGEPIPEKKYTFRSKTSNATMLKELGTDIVSLANNHAYDYGEISLLDTMDTLNSQEILYAGAGNNREEARKPIYYIINDTKIAFIAATQIERNAVPDTKGATDTAAGVFRCTDDAELLETISEVKENADFVVVYIHWGTENTDVLDWLQTKQAVEIEAAGADLIIGDHPHVLQQIDHINDTPVIYSMGNFWFNSSTKDTCVLNVKLVGNQIKSVQFMPAIQQGCQTSLVGDTEKARILDYMRSISPNVQIDEQGYVTYNIFR